MDLPNLFAIDTQQAATKLCVVIITDNTVQTGLIRVHPSGVEVVARSSVVPYEAVKNIHVTADEAFQQLGRESEDVNDVVFVLEQSWLDPQGEVDARHQPIIEKLRKELLLNPVGFLVQQEIMVDHITAKRPQLSCLAVLWTQQALAGVWVDHGAQKGGVTVGRSGELLSDVRELLHQLQLLDPARPLPNTLICTTLALAAPTLTQLQQSLLELPWQEIQEMPELPSIELVPPSTSSKAVLEIAGTAMQAALSPVDQSTVDHSGNQQIENGEQTALPLTGPELLPEDDIVREEEMLSVQAVEAGVASTRLENAVLAADMVTGEDFPSDSLQKSELPTSFGVPIAADSKTQPELAVELPATMATVGAKTATGQTHAGQVAKGHPATQVRGTTKPLARTALSKKKKRMAIAGVAALGVAITFISIAITMVVASKGLVMVTPKTETISRDVQLTLDPTAESSDAGNNILKARQLTAPITVTGETETTGIKLVGEKAQGDVAIFNKTNAPKTFSKGTKVKSGSLVFLLDADVEIPAASVSAKPGGEEKKYGQADVKVVAAEIGVDSNISRDTELRIEDYGNDTFSSVTKTEISGGSSREIQVVGQTDIEVLLSDLKKEAEEHAKTVFNEQLADGEQVVIQPDLKTTQTDYSAKLGDEAELLSLTVEFTATGLAYSKQDVKPIAQAILSTLVPEGFSMEGSQPQVLSAATASQSGEVVVDANISVTAVAVVDTTAVQQVVAGKQLKEAQASVMAQPGVGAATVSIVPMLVNWIWPYMPRSTDAIIVEFVAVQ